MLTKKKKKKKLKSLPSTRYLRHMKGTSRYTTSTSEMQEPQLSQITFYWLISMQLLFNLRGLYLLAGFFARFYKGHNFSELFAYVQTKPLLKRGLPLKEGIRSHGWWLVTRYVWSVRCVFLSTGRLAVAWWVGRGMPDDRCSMGNEFLPFRVDPCFKASKKLTVLPPLKVYHVPLYMIFQ